MTDEEAKEFTRKYCEAMAKGLEVSSWKGALYYLGTIAVNVSDSSLWKEE